ncbi:MAG: CD225/dispanin family protein [Bacteroidaceae bacterium]|nr:CD225/dispanin family protein [Bacteroidaceae bacterium]
MQNQNKPDSNLIYGILCTFCCCLPLGIVSIVYASKVDSLFMIGDYQGAQEAADKAKKYAMYGAVASAIVWALYFFAAIVTAVAK